MSMLQMTLHVTEVSEGESHRDAPASQNDSLLPFSTRSIRQISTYGGQIQASLY